MAAGAVIPDGFVLDQKALPDGFVIDQKPPGPGGVAASAMDFLKSIPGGMINPMAQMARGEQIESEQRASAFGAPNAGPEIPTGNQAAATLGLPTPQGMAGRFGQSVGNFLGNPASYLGPGSAGLKIGGAVLGGLGSQAGEETGIPGAQLAGAMAGGVAAGKMLGPTAPRAEIPTAAELKGAAKQGYNAVNASDLKVAPSGVWEVAENAKQELLRDGFDPESKVFKLLGDAQRVPDNPEQFISAQTLGVFNKRLQRIAQETQPANGGAVKPTEDAAAASVALGHFKSFGENIPARDVMAGDSAAYSSAFGEANANYAASQRVGNFDTRLTKAENATDRQVYGNIDNQIRQKAGAMLDNPKALRGLSQDEINQLQLINSGTGPTNLLRQLGRGGAAHVIPIMGQLDAAAKTGGASLPVWAAMIAARLGSNAITKSRANTFADMLAQRSPLYQQRQNALPPMNNMPLLGSLGRASILGLQ